MSNHYQGRARQLQASQEEGQAGKAYLLRIRQDPTRVLQCQLMEAQVFPIERPLSLADQ